MEDGALSLPGDSVFSTSDSVTASSLQAQPFFPSRWTLLLLASCIFPPLFIALACHVLLIASLLCIPPSVFSIPPSRIHPSDCIRRHLLARFRASSFSCADLGASPPALRVSLSLPRHRSFSTFPSLQLRVCLLTDPSVGVVQLALPACLPAWLASWLPA